MRWTIELFHILLLIFSLPYTVILCCNKRDRICFGGFIILNFKNVTPEEGTAYHSLNSRLISRTTIVLQPADCTCGRKTVTKIYWLFCLVLNTIIFTWLMGWKLSISWQEWGELEESHSNEQHEDNDIERPILEPSDFDERNSVGRKVGF